MTIKDPNLTKPAILKLPAQTTIKAAGVEWFPFVSNRWGERWDTVDSVNVSGVTAIEIAPDSEIDEVIIAPGGFAYPDPLVSNDLDFRAALNAGQFFVVGAKKPWVGRIDQPLISLIPTHGMRQNDITISPPTTLEGGRLSLKIYQGQTPPELKGGIRDPLTKEFRANPAGIAVNSANPMYRAFCVCGRSWFEASYKAFPSPASTGQAITVNWYGVSSWRTVGSTQCSMVLLRSTTYPPGSTSLTMQDNFVSDCPYDFIVLAVTVAGGGQDTTFDGRLRAHDE